MPKKSKGPSTRTLLAKWSKAVRERDGNVCAVCKSPDHLNAHHILPKERYPSLKLELINGISLCVRHHKFGKLSAHTNAIWFAWWLKWNRRHQLDWALENMQ